MVAAEQRLKRQKGPGAEVEVRGVEKLPHSVRAMVPPSVRKGLRKMAGRERPE